ncbi:MAG: phage portal protein, partial [Alphaproteobacteria bacterium]|nr:phage portal protein [Alphaproteobacteria bacterium]
MLNFFPKKHDSKASRTGPLLAWHNLGQPQWTPRRYDQLAEQGYRKNVVAHRCISLIAQLVASIPLTLYDKE